jgi:hypothetical protein
MISDPQSSKIIILYPQIRNMRNNKAAITRGVVDMLVIHSLPRGSLEYFKTCYL